MRQISRRGALRRLILGTTALAGLPSTVAAASRTGAVDGNSPRPAASPTERPAVIYPAREVVTLDPSQPQATAVAVHSGRILGVGTIDELSTALASHPLEIDRSFERQVIVPGFIAQHDHPVLAGLTMSSEILSIEDWVLPGRTIRAVSNQADFIARLRAASEKLADPKEPLLSWGYHRHFFGPLTRSDLDRISTTRPIIVWARSCHAFTLNSAALAVAGVTNTAIEQWPNSAREQSDLATGHFWEQGVFSLLPMIAPMVINPTKFRSGLALMRDYMHAKGITFGNEPGGMLDKPIQNMVNAVMSPPSMPFRWSFMVDGKSMIARYPDDDEVIAASRNLEDWYGGMTALAKGSAKLFADGAIYSLGMQLREPFLDGHAGEWMMDEPLFLRGFRVYWDAGYQLHIHVNGDAGLDRVLQALESNMRRNPRPDHRTVIVHFAVSDPDQLARIKNLGAMVSANPYYVTALADKYGDVGLGPKRADEMVRLGDLERAGIPYALHSDMPMAPGDPLFLIWCAVNRVTASGRIAAPEQRASVEAALRAVTLNAAYSHRLEKELGSIEIGKLANFTILNANPLKVDPMAIKDIGVWGTVVEGRVQAAPRGPAFTSIA